MDEQTQIATEQVVAGQVTALATSLGYGAMFVDLHDIDYTRGRGVLDEGRWCLWTRDGRRITISYGEHGLIVAQGREVDPERPPAAYPEISAHLQRCINPDCNKNVDRRYRKSGACCREHMNYECTHPDCVSRAVQNGWARATHRYGTKIAFRHRDYRKKVSNESGE